MKEELLQRINYFGIQNQKIKFGEEADELKEAITEYQALNELVGGAKLKKLREHIAEEIADNFAMLIQFQLFYDISDEIILKYLQEKNSRTKQRTLDGYYKRNGK
jgi:NTP pyrophosphatase (non-canonical NTP hydrolase)